MGLHAFSKGMNLKMNVIAGLEFELAYYDLAVLHVSHYTMSNRSSKLE